MRPAVVQNEKWKQGRREDFIPFPAVRLIWVISWQGGWTSKLVKWTVKLFYGKTLMFKANVVEDQVPGTVRYVCKHAKVQASFFWQWGTDEESMGAGWQGIARELVLQLLTREFMKLEILKQLGQGIIEKWRTKKKYGECAAGSVRAVSLPAYITVP